MSKPFLSSRNPSLLGLDDEIPFGIFQGFPVSEVLAVDPQYISWLIANTRLKFYESVHQELKYSKRRPVPQYCGVEYDSIIFDNVPF